MNKDTQTIMQLLGVDEQTALKIQNKMGENGLDFSECDQREFNRAARTAYRQILHFTRIAITFWKGKSLYFATPRILKDDWEC